MARYLLDTNVLLRLASPTSGQHAAAAAAVRALLSGAHELFLAPQVAMEFWSVATRPVDVNGFGWTVAETESELGKLINVGDFAGYDVHAVSPETILPA